VPSVLLFGLLAAGMPVAGALMSGAVVAGLAAVQALLLADPRRQPGDAPEASADGDCEGGAASPAGPGIPTAAAVRALLQPGLRAFVAALFLSQMASTALAAFYPIYLTERVGLAAKWVGLIAQVGVVFEIFFVLGCGWFVRRLGTRGVLVAGLLGTVVRLGMLAASADPVVAVGSQVLHGALVVVLGVLPQPFLDRHAADDCRHSMQGVFVMLMGCGKVLGSLAAGPVAAYSLQAVFGYGGALCAAGALLATVAFRERRSVTPAPSETIRGGRQRVAPPPHRS
jgi:PPP family 3-phenylpropionic acid transporter